MARAKKNPKKSERNPRQGRHTGDRDSRDRGGKAFPYRQKDDKALEEGTQVARARYYGAVRSTAKDIISEEKSDERIDERISEEADSAVTYTRDAYEIVELSDRTDAIEDVLGSKPSDWGADGVSDVITKIAYFAYEQDLREMVEAYKNEGAED